jgi:putative ATPase
MKEMGYGEDCQYSHNYQGNFSQQEYLPETLSGKAFYTPQNNPKENEIRKFLKHNWQNKYGY